MGSSSLTERREEERLITGRREEVGLIRRDKKVVCNLKGGVCERERDEKGERDEMRS